MFSSSISCSGSSRLGLCAEARELLVDDRHVVLDVDGAVVHHEAHQLRNGSEQLFLERREAGRQLELCDWRTRRLGWRVDAGRRGGGGG